LSAIREDLLALKAQAAATDVKNLAALVKQKVPMMERNYAELAPYMTVAQRSRASWWLALDVGADTYLRTGKDNLTGAVTGLVPLMIADLDDVAKNLKAIT